MFSCSISFVPSDVAFVFLELSPDSVSSPIVEVACCSYMLLMHATSRALEGSGDWLQVSFTARDFGSYLEVPIQTRSETPTQAPMPVSFQGRISIASLQRAFPGHYISSP